METSSSDDSCAAINGLACSRARGARRQSSTRGRRTAGIPRKENRVQRIERLAILVQFRLEVGPQPLHVVLQLTESVHQNLEAQVGQGNEVLRQPEIGH